VKVGDLVKRDVWRGFYQIMEIYENSYRAKRLCLLNLTTGRYVTDIRPSHVKVLS
jgi:hypothetical protein